VAPSSNLPLIEGRRPRSAPNRVFSGGAGPDSYYRRQRRARLARCGPATNPYPQAPERRFIYASLAFDSPRHRFDALAVSATSIDEPAMHPLRGPVSMSSPREPSPGFWRSRCYHSIRSKALHGREPYSFRARESPLRPKVVRARRAALG